MSVIKPYLIKSALTPVFKSNDVKCIILPMNTLGRRMNHSPTFFRSFFKKRIYDKHEPYHNVGFNLPFSIENRYKLLAKTILYWGSAFGYPFFCIHMIKIKSA